MAGRLKTARFLLNRQSLLDFFLNGVPNLVLIGTRSVPVLAFMQYLNRRFHSGTSSAFGNTDEYSSKLMRVRNTYQLAQALTLHFSVHCNMTQQITLFFLELV